MNRSPFMHSDWLIRWRALGRLFWRAGLVLATTSSIAGARQPEERKTGAGQEIRTDVDGDPLPAGAVARLGTLRDNIGEIGGDIVLSPDGKAITATSDWFIIPLRLWDLETGRVVRHFNGLENPTGNAKVCRVAFSPDGKLLAAGDSTGTVRIGATDKSLKIRELAWPESVACLAFLPDGKTMASASADGTTLVWDVTKIGE